MLERTSMSAPNKDLSFDVPAADARRGAWLSGTLAVLTAATLGIAFATPPLSGPWCTGGCFPYPFTGIESRYPRDYYWMFPAMVVSVLFIAVLISVHRAAAERVKFFSALGLVLGTVGASTLLIDYWVQLAVIQPSVLKGETDGIALLSQFNAHGVFIALEELAFFVMSFGLFCLAPVFWRARAPGRAMSWVLVSNFALAIIALVSIAAVYGLGREYFFEIAIISIVWLTLPVWGLLLAVLFHRAREEVRTRERAGHEALPAPQ